MKIRPIEFGELNVFAGYSDEPEHNSALRDYVSQQWRDGYSKPEWCLVAEEDGSILGRVMLWSLPGHACPSDIARLELPWQERYKEVGAQLLQEALVLAKQQGATHISYLVETPPTTYPERRIELLDSLGFKLIRDGLRWEWTPKVRDDGRVDVPARLVFRPLDEVGEGVFIEALQRVSAGSLDSWVQQFIQELGPVEAAKKQFADESTLDHKPHWWQLAYTPDGTLVGLVMMSRNSANIPIVGYIGVVPQQRGHGYVDDLLSCGTAIMAAEGAECIRADTDRRNPPMSDAFRRAGYAQFRTRADYQIKLG